MGTVFAAWDRARPQGRAQAPAPAIAQPPRGPAPAAAQSPGAREAGPPARGRGARHRHPRRRGLRRDGVRRGRGAAAGDGASERDPGASCWIYLQAGLGLAAAHDVGLVHRDFKPDNVLVGLDGRARVADFGLARAGGGESELATSRSSGDTSDFAGTPGYMAPEQRRGEPVDARADQFAFCRALQEALATAAGGPGPRWLHRALQRGLADDAAARWPAMPPLLAALRHDRARVWQRAGIVLGAAATLGASALLVRGQASPCDGLQGDDAGPWDTEGRAAVVAHIAAASQPDAPAIAASVDAALARYGEAWSQMRLSACEAHRVRGEESAVLFDARMACLERRRSAAAALTTAVVEAEAEALPLLELLPAVHGLPRVDDCADLDALAEVVPLPGDAQARAAIAAANDALERAWARRYLFWEREPLLGPVAAIAEVARAHDYPPLRAKALSLLSDLHDDGGEFAAATAALHEGLLAAAAAHDDRTAGVLAIKLVAVLGLGQRRYAEAETAAQMAAAWLQRGDASEQDWAGLRSAQAMVASLQGHREDAAVLQREAIARLDADPNATAAERAGERNNYGATLMHLGRHAEAAAQLDEALALLAADVGERHPLFASVLQTKGAAALEAGDLPTALAAAERAHAIFAEVSGPRSFGAGDALDNLANIERSAGRLGLARTHAREAVAILEALLGPDHAEVGDAVSNLALVEAELGECAAAAADLQRSLAIAVRDGGEEGHEALRLRALVAEPCPPPARGVDARDGSTGSVSQPQEP
ncbi:MAG: tetratricopeptide repeat-containing protein kinase family protein [Nannocystaceae bacterium]